jgi:hypothetical protein
LFYKGLSHFMFLLFKKIFLKEDSSYYEKNSVSLLLSVKH